MMKRNGEVSIVFVEVKFNIKFDHYFWEKIFLEKWFPIKKSLAIQTDFKRRMS